jgi:predicted esterase
MPNLGTWIALMVLCAQSSIAQRVVQIRWPSKHASPPVSIAGVQGEWLPAFRLAVAAMPEETIVATSLSQGQWLGLRPDEAKKLQGLFSNYYSRLRQSDLFGAAPSALQYCFSDHRPAEGLATVYIPNKVSSDTKTIVFLHGYGGSLLAYLHLLSSAFSNHVIICPAYGISCANVPAPYVTEALKAVSTHLKVETGKPLLIGLSAGGFGACRLFVQKPELFRGLVCLAAYPPSDTAQRFSTGMDVRFVCGSLEPYVANGSLRRQMQALKPKVKSLDWKILDGADHYFLLSHEELTRKTLLEWESP